MVRFRKHARLVKGELTHNQARLALSQVNSLLGLAVQYPFTY